MKRDSRRDIIRRVRSLRKSTRPAEPAEPVVEAAEPVEAESFVVEKPPQVTALAPAPSSSVLVLPSGTPSSQDVLSNWLTNKSEKTVKAYLQDVMALQTWLEVSNPSEAVRLVLSLTGPEANALALQWLGSMREKGLSTSTRARRLSTLKSITEAARLLGAISWRVEVRGPKTQTLKDTSGPGVEASAKMLSVCGSGDWGKRDRAILLLSLNMGLRREEICKLTLSDYKVAARKLFVQGKGEKDKLITVPDTTAKALDAWLEVRGARTHQGLFVNAKTGTQLTVDGCYYIVKKVARKAGVKAAPHALRHTAITSGLDLADIRSVQSFSRHSKPETVMIYDDNKQDLGGKVSQLVADRLQAAEDALTSDEEDLSLEDLLEAAGNVEEEETDQ